jgi:uncharacterized membrane protein YjfL (UPF0719 family)
MLVINLVYAVVALFIGALSLRVVDRWLLRKIDLEEEIKKGNLAASVFASTVLLFVAIIVGLALGR